jgi:hypothetical protein
MPQIYQGQSLGGSLGSAFGTGLGGTLSQLANQRANRLKQQAGLSGVPGISPEQAEQLANLDPQTLSPIIKELINQPRREATGKAISGILNQYFGGGDTNQEPIDLSSLGGKEALDVANLAINASNKNREFAEKQRVFQEKEQAKESKVKEAERFKRQAAIDKKNKPIIDTINKYRDSTEKAAELIKSMKADLASGNVASGWSGTLQTNLPSLQNETTAKYAANATELPTLLDNLPGLGSDYKRKLQQASKAYINQPKGTQEALLDQADNFVNKKLLKLKALDNVLEKYGENQPPNIENEIKREMHRLEKSNKKASEFQEGDDFTQDDYDHPENLPDGFAVEWDGIPQQVVNGEWVPLEGV